MAYSTTLSCPDHALSPDRGVEASGLAPEVSELWQRLEACAKLPMQHQAFSLALAGTLLADALCQVFVGEDAQFRAALLPLSCRSAAMSRWTMMGAVELTEPTDALYESDAAVRDLARKIASDGRPLSLDRVPRDSALIPALQSAMRGKGRVSVRPTVPCPTITLHKGWRQAESQFNSGRRSDFRRAARRAKAFGELEYEMLSPGPEDFDALFDEAIAVELASWKKQAGSAIAIDRAKEDFFRTYFRSLCEQGAMRIAFLRIDGRAIAMHLAVELQDRYWLFKIGFDETYEKCSPGTLLMLYALSWSAQRNLKSFELLGSIEPWIIAFWTREQHDFVRLRTYPYTVRGAVAIMQDGLAWMVARIGRIKTA